MSENERIERDFNLRDVEEKQALIEQTWCDQCQEVNLGMVDPVEYELNGVVYVEGKCARCGTLSLTELTEDEF